MPTSPAILSVSLLLATSLTMHVTAPASPLPAGRQPQPEKTPAAPPPAPNPAPAAVHPDEPAKQGEVPKEYTTVEELLAALETADQDLRTLTADLTYDNIAGEVEGGDRTIRRGRVSFSNPRLPSAASASPATPAKPPAPADPPAVKPAGPAEPVATALAPSVPAARPGKSFAVTFDTRFSDNKRFVEARTFILNQGILVEKLAGEKRINRYRLGVAAGGAAIDPLKIGEGPFPIPFGQKPADIKARFDVSLLPGLKDFSTEDADARKTFDACYQLRLVPKPGTKAAKEFTEARIWFAKKDLLPIMARTNKIGGGSDEFHLINIRLNQPIEDQVFSTATPEGWTVEEKEMR